MTTDEHPVVPRSDGERPPAPYRIWSMTTAFNKQDAPIRANIGKSYRHVVVMESETFKRLMREHPEFAAKLTFELGDLDG